MKCFVIMPFGNPDKDSQQARKLDLIYTQWIKPTVESINIPSLGDERIACHRADKQFRPEEIITHIIENLVTADIVIADLSGRNPNVFYELGVRHAVNNNTILIAENLDDVPFDLRGLRTIVYKYEPEYMLNLKSSLEQAVIEIIKESDRIDNPVRRFLYNREVDKLIREPIPPGYDVYRNIVSEMASLKKELSNHVNEVRHIMRLITTSENQMASVPPQNEIDLAFFEGIWKSDSGGTYCARIVEGELLIPYCYRGDRELTAHYYNCRLIAETLFSRFRWFDTYTAGYAFLRIKSDDMLIGGWWFRNSIPPEISIDISRINDSIPGMRNIVWRRDKKSGRMPDWAESYFKQVRIEQGIIRYNGFTSEGE